MTKSESAASTASMETGSLTRTVKHCVNIPRGMSVLSRFHQARRQTQRACAGYCRTRAGSLRSPAGLRVPSFLTAPAAGATRVAFATSAAAAEREFTALRAWIAFVSFHAGLTNLLRERRDPAVGFARAVPIALVMAVARHRLEMLRARRLKNLGHRFRLGRIDDAFLSNLLGLVVRLVFVTL